MLGFFVFLIMYLKNVALLKVLLNMYFVLLFFNALFVAIKQKKEDIFNLNPDFFRYQGLIIFTGRQGIR